MERVSYELLNRARRLSHFVEARITLPTDPPGHKRQRLFLFFCLVFVLLNLPFMIVFSCFLPGYRRTALLSFYGGGTVLQTGCLCSLFWTRTSQWPRFIFITLFYSGLPALLLFFGGFEFCVLAPIHVGALVIFCLLVYDTHHIPLRWLALSSATALACGIYEMVSDFNADFEYSRFLRVIVGLLSIVLFASGLGVFLWSLLYQYRAQLEQCAEAEARAVAATEAKLAFFACISHEIRTPLNAVLGLTDLLRSTELTSTQVEYVDSIGLSGRSLLKLINDILDYSKLGAHKMVLERAPFNLRGCIDDVVATQRAVANQKKLDLTVFVPRTCPSTVWGDEMRLKQVLLNLLSNTMKFTHHGSVSLKITFDEARLFPAASTVDSSSAPVRPYPANLCPPANSYLAYQSDEPTATVSSPNSQDLPRLEVPFTFTITDTGIGMTQAQLDALFEPFTQADVSTTREYGGTGLGLSICRQLISLWNGSIQVSSKGLGHGCTFEFVYPMPMVAPQAFCTATPRRRASSIVLVEFSSSPLHLQSPYKAGLLELLHCFSDHVISANSVEDLKALPVKCNPDNDDATHPSTSTLVVLLLGNDDPLADELEGFLQHLHALAMKGSGSSYSPSSCSSSSRTNNALARMGIGFAPMDRLDHFETLFQMKMFPLPAMFHQLESFLVHGPTPRSPRSGSLLPTTSGVYRQPHASAIPPNLQNLSAPHPILIVEDVRVNQMVICTKLKQLNLPVELAENGLEAVAMCKQKRYQCIFMDCHMPLMDGYQASRTIRGLEDEYFRSVPIIALTAAVGEEDRRKCRESGMQHFLSKPFAPTELFDILQTVLPRVSADPSPAASMVLP